MTHIIQGNAHEDIRGTISFVNDFDFQKIRRAYSIAPASTDVIRAWQGHKIEEKWFWVIRGSFSVKLIKMADWQTLPASSSAETIELNASNPQIMHIPGGYLNGFRALEPGSILMVYSDVTLEVSSADDYRISLEEIPWQ